MSHDNFSGKFMWLKKLWYIAIVGIALLLLGLFAGVSALTTVGVILIIPVVVFAYVLAFLHWKHRYIGTHSTLWGVLLAIETSGWFKIVYLFRHILPDMRHSGRYSEKKEPGSV